MPSRLRRIDEPGHIHFWIISCYRRLAFLWHDAMKNVIIDGFRLLQNEFGICMNAYVIMPDHIHFILLPHRRGADQPIAISLILHRFKKFVGAGAKETLRRIWKQNGGLWSEPLNKWARRKFPKQQVFNTRGYDFNIYDFDTLLEKIDYCHKNPVTRELVDEPSQWRWSSYRYYDLDDRSVLAMDWDGRWPIEW